MNDNIVEREMRAQDYIDRVEQRRRARKIQAILNTSIMALSGIMIMLFFMIVL